MLEWLNQTEITSITFGETIVSVQLKLGGSTRVFTIIISMLGSEVAVMEILVVRAINIIITSDNPDKLLNWVVKVELDLVGKSAE